MDTNNSNQQTIPKSISDYLYMNISSIARDERKDFTAIVEEFNNLISSLGIKYQSSIPINEEEALTWYIDTIKQQLIPQLSTKGDDIKRLAKILSIKLD